MKFKDRVYEPLTGKLDDRPSKTYPEKLDDRPARPVPKYESTDKPITLWAVLKIAPECSKITVPSFYETFNHFGLSNPIGYWKNSNLYNWLEKHPHAYPWFVEHGFLREAPEETYSVGDWFSIDGDFHNLVRVNSYSVCLINMRNSNRKRDPVIVKDSTEISRDEMIKIWGIDPVNIKKIPSPLTPSQ